MTRHISDRRHEHAHRGSNAYALALGRTDTLPTAALTLANVVYEKKGAIAYVTVNRPKVLNALNTPTWADLRTASRTREMTPRCAASS